MKDVIPAKEIWESKKQAKKQTEVQRTQGIKILKEILNKHKTENNGHKLYIECKL